MSNSERENNETTVGTTTSGSESHVGENPHRVDERIDEGTQKSHTYIDDLKRAIIKSPIFAARGSKDPDVNAYNDHTCHAALRATAAVFPIVATLGTILAYIALEEHTEIKTVVVSACAIAAGTTVAIFAWIAVAIFHRSSITPQHADFRNFSLISERLDQVKSRLDDALRKDFEQQQNPEGTVEMDAYNKAYTQALRECEKIERSLKRKGMPWVTGLGYIELWHRIHRAEEALIRVESCSAALEGAMRDEARLVGSNMVNRDSLLERLRGAVAILDDPKTSEQLSYLSELEDTRHNKSNRAKLAKLRKKVATPEDRVKAMVILSELQHEINTFRDDVWEGLVNARNRLANTSVALGLSAYILLGLAILAGADYQTIVWATVWFLVGAIVGLFARSQAEWSSDTAVDDFGLSTARLFHIPWLSGLAAVGGVMIASVIDSQLMSSGGASGGPLSTIFVDKPSLLFIAAFFGLAPDLIIRRLSQQAEQYKGDLQSTLSSQSTATTQNNEKTNKRR